MEEIRTENPGNQSHVKYLLKDICGLNILEDLVIYAENQEKFQAKELNMERVPSKAAFAGRLRMTDGKQIRDAAMDVPHSETKRSRRVLYSSFFIGF